MARLGAGFDIVSGGELARVLAAGGDPRKVVFSGVGKSEAEIEQALRAGILCLNLESEAELERVDAIAARLGVRAPVAFRVNPDVDAKTHPYISTGLKDNKFGVAYADAERLYRDAARRKNLELVGIGCHIGSQLTERGAVRRRRRAHPRARRAPGARAASHCRTSTSAAASASATRTRRRRRSPSSSTARWACLRAARKR